MTRKYDRYTWIALLAIIMLGILVAGIDSEDIDELCQTQNSILRRGSSTWNCSQTHYGEVYYHNETDPLTITISDVNTMIQVTGFETGDCTGITCSNTSFTLAKNTTYMIDSSFSFTGGTNSDYHCAIYLNNVEQNDCEFHRSMGSTSSIGVSTISCLKQGLVDATLDLRCKDEDAPASNIEFYALNINIVEII